MGERRGTKALELWCRRVTEGYSGVKVDNMTTSWRDGLAFCALIHHFRPDLIDFSSLKKENVFYNNALAFRTAESCLGIPALLDAEDMAEHAVPDRLSILTYLSQYYQHFASSGSSPSRIVVKRTPPKDCENLSVSPSSASPPSKMPNTGIGRRDPCTSCGHLVFLAQRLMVEGQLYHRTCFRCARCNAQLTLANCYQTEVDGQFCCETCPDEELNLVSSNKTPDLLTPSHKTPEDVKITNDCKQEINKIETFENMLIQSHKPKSASVAFGGFMNNHFNEHSQESVLPPVFATSQLSNLKSVTADECEKNIETKTVSSASSVDKHTRDNNIIKTHSEINKKPLFVVNKSENNDTNKLKLRPVKGVKDENSSVIKTSIEKKSISRKPDDNLKSENHSAIGTFIEKKNVTRKVDNIKPKNSPIIGTTTEKEAVSRKAIDNIKLKNTPVIGTTTEKESVLRKAIDITKFKNRSVLETSTEKKGLSHKSIDNIKLKNKSVLETTTEKKGLSLKSIDNPNETAIKKEVVLYDVVDKNNSALEKKSALCEVVDENTNKKLHGTENIHPTPCDPNIDHLKSEKKIDDVNNDLDNQFTSRFDERRLEKVNVMDTTISKSDSHENIDNISLVKSRMKFFENDLKTNETVDSNSLVVIKDDQINNSIENIFNKNINDNPIDDNPPAETEYHTDIIVNTKLDKDYVSMESVVNESHSNNGISQDVSYPTETVDDKEECEKLNIEPDITNIEDIDIKNESELLVHNNDKKDDEILPLNSDTALDTSIETKLFVHMADTIENLQNNHEIIENNTSELNKKDISNIVPEGVHEDIEIAKNTIDDKNVVFEQQEEVITYPDHLDPFFEEPERKNSSNPFGSDESDDDDDEQYEKKSFVIMPENRSGSKPPRPPPPKISYNKYNLSSEVKPSTYASSLNPFSSDNECDDDDEEILPQIPIPIPRHSLGNMSSLSDKSISLTSITSKRKKAPAPKPPELVVTPVPALRKINISDDSDLYNLSSISNTSSSNLSSISPLPMKRRPAPGPPKDQPAANSTPLNLGVKTIDKINFNNDESLIASPVNKNVDKIDLGLTTPRKVISAAEFDNDPDISKIIEKDDGYKKQENSSQQDSSPTYTDKSASGQWKRRKGPAPAIPLLQRNNPTLLIPLADIQNELEMLENQHRGLERQGVRLEEIIRDRCENNTTEKPSSEPDPETDELVLQLFDLVNERNELLRRQAELMYIRRQQRLEQEHVDLEFQIRSLMARPEANKTDADKVKEEQLIQRLLEVVERRNEVVTCLEMDRVREKNEDISIKERMASHRAKRDELSSSSLPDISGGSVKKEKKKKWTKRDKSKKIEAESQNDPDIVSLKKEKKHKKGLSNLKFIHL